MRRSRNFMPVSRRSPNLLARHTGVGFDDLSPHVYVHYEERAAQHLFAVTSSLDSMLVGEHQILGQVRAAFRTAQERGDAGSALHDVVEHALHAAKRAHAETGIDAVGTTLIEAGLAARRADRIRRDARRRRGRRRDGVDRGRGVAGRRCRRPARRESHRELNARPSPPRVGGRAAPMTELEHELSRRRRRRHVHRLRRPGRVGRCHRAGDGQPAGPTAVRPRRRRSPRRRSTGRRSSPALRCSTSMRCTAVDNAAGTDDVLEARRIVDIELAAYVARVGRRESRRLSSPCATRQRSDGVGELHRLERRLPNLDDAARNEIAATVQRVVDKVLHAPTVRVQELADTAGPTSYPEALRRLFDLDPAAPAAIASPRDLTTTDDHVCGIGGLAPRPRRGAPAGHPQAALSPWLRPARCRAAAGGWLDRRARRSNHAWRS